MEGGQITEQVELPGVRGEQPVAVRRRCAEDVQGRGVAVLGDQVGTDAEHGQREPGVRLGRVGQPAVRGARAAGLGGQVVPVSGEERLFGTEVQVLGRTHGLACVQQGRDDVPAVGDLGGERAVGDARVQTEFLRDERHEGLERQRTPAVGGSQARLAGVAPGPHPQQAAARRKPVGEVAVGLALAPFGPGHLADQTVEERGGREGVGRVPGITHGSAFRGASVSVT